MYRRGHHGVALLVYAPIAYVLLDGNRLILAAVGAALMFSLATLPDIDQRIRFVKHRGATHTVLFALVVGVVLAGLGWLVGNVTVGLADQFVAVASSSTDGAHTGGSIVTLLSERFSATQLALFGFFIGTMAVLSHLLADLLTIASFAPFWPLSSWSYSLGITRAANTTSNWLLFVGGICAIGLVFAQEFGLLTSIVP
jgi:inner membrane protein